MDSKNTLPPTKIKPSDVYEVLEARKFVEKIYNEILHDIKNSSSYIRLKEIALQQLASFDNGEIDSKHISEPSGKKKTYDVGFLSYCIGSTLTKTVEKKLQTLQDDIYAASQVVIEELEKEKSADTDENGFTNSLPKRRKAPRSDFNPIKKRCLRSDSDSDVSPCKGLSKRLKKPNSKYYSEDIFTPMTEYRFNDKWKES